MDPRYLSQEDLIYPAIDKSAWVLVGSGLSSDIFVYCLRRSGREVTGVSVLTPSHLKISDDQKPKVDEFAQKVREAFAELRSTSRVA